jgi:hypothetical protein
MLSFGPAVLMAFGAGLHSDAARSDFQSGCGAKCRLRLVSHANMVILRSSRRRLPRLGDNGKTIADIGHRQNALALMACCLK